MFTVPASLADLDPAVAPLPRVLEVCALGDGDDVAAAAQQLILGGYPARPTDAIKLIARTWRLYLTLWRRHRAIHRAFVNDTLLVALGQEVAARKHKRRLQVAHTSATATGSIDAAFEGNRQAWNIRREPEVRRVIDLLVSGEDLLDVPHPVADPERLAGQVVASVRDRGAVSDDDRMAVWLAADEFMLMRIPVSITLVVALALVLGVMEPSGEASTNPMSALIGTKYRRSYVAWADADRTAKALTGRWAKPAPGDGTSVRALERWRRSLPYRRLMCPTGPHCN